MDHESISPHEEFHNALSAALDCYDQVTTVRQLLEEAKPLFEFARTKAYRPDQREEVDIYLDTIRKIDQFTRKDGGA